MAHLLWQKKGQMRWNNQAKAKDAKIMAVADRFGLPLAICTTSASPHEIKLIEAVLESKFVKATPKRLIVE